MTGPPPGTDPWDELARPAGPFVNLAGLAAEHQAHLALQRARAQRTAAAYRARGGEPPALIRAQAGEISLCRALQLDERAPE